MSARLPQLSIVVTTRNDNHGQDLWKRTRIFVETLNEQMAKRDQVAELVVVEWNPPAERKSLEQEFGLASSANLLIRTVVVPPTEHSAIRNSSSLPLFQMIAKNVGIRRARGEFVLVTNIDILMSDHLLDWALSARKSHNALYRSDRVDVDRNIPIDSSLEQRLRYCENNPIRINTLDGIREMNEGTRRNRHPIVHYTRTLAYAVKDAVSFFAMRYRLKNLSVKEAALFLALLPLFPLMPKLHTNACGDWMLMHRDAWSRLRGYWERPWYSLHIDTLFLHFAYFSGVVVHNLPGELKHFHIDHEAGWTPQTAGALKARMEEKRIPIIYDSQLMFWASLLRFKPFAMQNQVNWGMKDQSLQVRDLPRHQARGDEFSNCTKDGAGLRRVRSGEDASSAARV